MDVLIYIYIYYMKSGRIIKKNTVLLKEQLIHRELQFKNNWDEATQESQTCGNMQNDWNTEKLYVMR